jgi:hypothetical protein
MNELSLRDYEKPFTPTYKPSFLQSAESHPTLTEIYAIRESILRGTGGTLMPLNGHHLPDNTTVEEIDAFREKRMREGCYMPDIIEADIRALRRERATQVQRVTEVKPLPPRIPATIPLLIFSEQVPNLELIGAA